jgi:hypothetical protein
MKIAGRTSRRRLRRLITMDRSIDNLTRIEMNRLIALLEYPSKKLSLQSTDDSTFIRKSMTMVPFKIQYMLKGATINIHAFDTLFVDLKAGKKVCAVVISVVQHDVILDSCMTWFGEPTQTVSFGGAPGMHGFLIHHYQRSVMSVCGRKNRCRWPPCSKSL